MLELLLVVVGAIVLPVVTAWLTLVSDLVVAAGIASVELIGWATRRRSATTPARAAAWPWRKIRRITLGIASVTALITIVGVLSAVMMGNTLATFVMHRALRQYEHQFKLDSNRTTFWKGAIAISDVKLVRKLDDGRQSDLTIDDAAFTLSWTHLLRGEIEFSRVEVVGVQGTYASERSEERTKALWPFVIEEFSVTDFDVQFLWIDRCPDAGSRSARLQIDRLTTRHLESRHWLLSFLVRSELEGRLNEKPLRIRHTDRRSSWEIGALATPILKGVASTWLCHLPDRGSVGVRCEFVHARDGDWELDVDASLDLLDGPPADKPENRLLRAAKAVGKLAKPHMHLHFRIDKDTMQGVSSLTDEGFIKILIHQQDAPETK